MYDKKVLGLAEAQAAVQAMIEEASKDRSRPVAIAVTDDRGDLIALVRMDGGKPLFVDIAISKAYTSAVMRRDTRKYLEFWRQQDCADHQPIFSGMSVIPGGVAITKLGETVVYGGIGVSGKPSGDEDETLAFVGLKALRDLLWPSR